jgi:hypothetical protein
LEEKNSAAFSEGSSVKEQHENNSVANVRMKSRYKGAQTRIAKRFMREKSGNKQATEGKTKVVEQE